ncbi:MAG: PepSY domain-containing protein [Beijerinckiaceae bacterium]|nr:MAG: PepSY domain-containing protein [Beijerinckiaceae bacterium]
MISTLAIAFALVGGATAAMADTPGPDWMPVEAVTQQLRDAGYTRIIQIEADDGHWEGEGIKDGRKMEFRVDPRSGMIIYEEPD